MKTREVWTAQDKVLLWVKYLQASRRLQRLNLDSFLKSFGFLVLLFFFWSLCYIVVSRTFNAMVNVEVIGPIILKRIISVGFFAAFIIVCGSHVLSAFSSLFRSHELPMLVSSPYPLQRLYRVQCLETLVHGGWVLGLFCLPILLAYGVQLRAALWFYPVVFLGLMGFLAIAGTLGILLMLVIARWIMSRTVPTVVSTVLFLGSFIALFMYVAFSNQILTKGVTPAKLGETLANMQLSSMPYLPSQWMSELMTACHTRDLYRVGLYMLLLGSTALALWHLVLELGERWYASAWLWSQERVGVSFKRREVHAYHPKLLILMRLLPRRISGFVYKEVRMFLRDFSQWGQMVLILALILFYIIQTRNVVHEETFNRIRVVMACFNVILLGFVQATLSIRYTYPSVSLEGRAFWVVASSENGIHRSYFAKYYIHSLALLAIGLGLGVVLNRIMNVDATLNSLSLFILGFFAFGFTGWTLGLGAVFRKFEATSTADVSSDTGTLMTMLVTISYFVVSIGFLAYYAFFHTPGTGLSEMLALHQEQGLMFYFTVFLFLQTCSILLPTAYGLKKLKESVI